MVGDAAHSVLPPTGEGINSGLEDCYVLGQVIDDTGREDCFEKYNSKRRSDLSALLEYALFLNDAFHYTVPGERLARTIFTLLELLFKKNEGFSICA